jgi:predicted nicotinamide N-methyase
MTLCQQSYQPAALLKALQHKIPAAELAVQSLPQCPDIQLWLLDENYPQWQLSNEQAAALMDNPPYWSFCWASGQVLARHILGNRELVRGKTVADFGAGSGIVAIAAKMAGAKRAIACDTDPLARLACEHNALLNRLTIETISDIMTVQSVDVISVADVFYDRDNLSLLASLQQRCSTLLVADSRCKGNALPKLSIIGEFNSHTVPDLDESKEFNHVFIYSN